ncbi:hypothetical protein ES703_125570 [subsurface metagenome]
MSTLLCNLLFDEKERFLPVSDLPGGLRLAHRLQKLAELPPRTHPQYIDEVVTADQLWW